MTIEEEKAYNKAYYQAHKEESRAYYQAHREELIERKKAYYQDNREQIKVYRQAHKEDSKAYQKADVNSLGESKHSIRCKSLRILKKMNLHIPGYETHHCFGYDDPTKFIYISKSLHSKIHQYLRDNNIDADSNHWLRIRDMVLNCNEYFYAKM